MRRLSSPHLQEVFHRANVDDDFSPPNQLSDTSPPAHPALPYTSSILTALPQTPAGLGQAYWPSGNEDFRVRHFRRGSQEDLSSRFYVADLIKSRKRSTRMTRFTARPQILVFIVNDKNIDVYRRIKKSCDGRCADMPQ
ncbi:uncharacterized protein BDZ99DRAFT_525797 [Mytilinidion resinicola]|uniref:Uncharacterized protein n=1 Tax=Mytilinidion resinicola TaxID=574789 RepID=A0A6A6Y7P4_9PEZI|nr:uncharacterized protein BDZ99DRAFT_525797 [Mytilinidion resinicola]KAF2804205.1 hypothetical protein BDZ99DRAFT_525797 [Mytilinidion resinicola]